jgi:hypothetical protein
MPGTGEVKLEPGTAQDPDAGYRSCFSHDTEKSKPGYYEVLLEDSGVKAQLTATPRVGVHKYTFPEGQTGHVVLDLGHGIYNYDGKVLWSHLRVENETTLTGYRITNGWARTNYTYFAITFSKPIKEYGYKDRDKALYKGFWRRFKMDRNFPEIAGRDVAAYFCFDEADGQELIAKVALSAVSTDGALKNLKAEGHLTYYVTTDIYEAYEQYLDKMGNDHAYTDMITGRRELSYHGIKIVDMHISHIPPTHSIAQTTFCLLTDSRNLAMAVNTSDYPGSEVRMWYNPDEMENRQRAVFAIGCEILDEELVTAYINAE